MMSVEDLALATQVERVADLERQLAAARAELEALRAECASLDDVIAELDRAPRRGPSS